MEDGISLVEARNRTAITNSVLAGTKYEEIVASAMDAIVAIDSKQEIIVFNKAAERMFQYSPADVIGKPISVLIPSRFHQVHATHVQDFGKSGSSTRAMGHLRPLSAIRANGEEFPIEASISQLRSDGEMVFTVIVRDVTDRLRAEANSARLTTELQTANQTLREQIQQREIAESSLLRAHKELRLRSEEMERSTAIKRRLAEMGEFLQACVTSAEARQVAEHSLQTLFPNSGGMVYLNREFDGLVEAYAGWNSASLTSKQTLEQHECWGLRRGRPHVVKSSDATTKCAHVADLSSCNCICVPMVAQGQPLGLFHMVWSENGDASVPSAMPEQEGIAISAAETLAFAIANVKLREKLKEQTIRDPLTQLYNRRYLEDALGRELSRARRANAPVGIIMIDVDNFKLFNDSFGHLMGDSLLRTLGSYLKSHVRPEDVPARYGGEEFALVLPGASGAIVSARAEALRKGFRGLPSDVCGTEQLDRHLSISCGVAVFPEDGDSMEELFMAADQALYEAKRGGKDRVVVARKKIEAMVQVGVSPAKAAAERKADGQMGT